MSNETNATELSVYEMMSKANAAFEAKDYATALPLYEKAAEQGDADAQNNLGCMYYNGDGVAQDYNKAREWYEKAAENGCEEAKQVLADWENKGANNGEA